MDSNGFLNSVSNPAGEAVQMTSDAGGLLSTYTDRRGKISGFQYDADGRLLRDADPVGGSQNLSRATAGNQFTVTRTTALGRVTTYATEHLPANRQLRTITAPDGTQTRTDEVIDAGTTHASTTDGMISDSSLGPDPRFGMESAIVKSASLDFPSGLQLSVTGDQSVVLSNPADPFSLTSLTNTSTFDGRTSTSQYTAATRTLVTTTPTGRTFTRTIDALGRLLSSQVSGLNAQTYAYDSRGQLVSIVRGSGPGARTLALSYNAQGFPQSITDPLGRVAQFAYDAAGRITGKTLPNGQVVSFEYDAGGNVVGLTPPGRPTHRFAYSDRNELTTDTPPTVPGSGATAYSHDLDRELSAVARPDGRSIAFDYDAGGRLAARRLITGNVTTGTETLSYDGSGRVSAFAAVSGVTTSYTYDGSLLSREAWSGAITGNVARTYDTSLRLASYSINGTTPIAFGYDGDGLLTSAGDLAITRDAQHGLPTANALDSIGTTMAYSGFGEITSFVATAGGNPFFSAAISRDALGRISQKAETIGGVTDVYVYSYDTVGQLIGVTKNNAAIESYAYDGNGNRTSATVAGTLVAASYDDQDRLVQYGTATRAYDGAGDLVSATDGSQATSYQYDQLGNLLGITLPSGTTITYVVDAKGRRVGKKVNGTLVKAFLYANQLLPVAELDGTGAVVSVFVYAGRTVPAYLIKGGTRFRLIADQVGSVRLVVNSTTGSIVQRIDYDSFGNVTLDTNPGFQPFGFAGGLHDAETGLVRLGTRDYDARAGRWLTKDMLGFSGNDSNLYRYVRNDPVNLTDATGLGTFGNFALGVAAGLYDVITLQFARPPPPPPVMLNGKPIYMTTGNLVTDWANLINSFLDEPAVDTGSLAYIGGDVCAGLVAGGSAAAGGRAMMAADAELAALHARNTANLAEAVSGQVDFQALRAAADEARIADIAERAAEKAKGAADRFLNTRDLATGGKDTAGTSLPSGLGW